MKLFDKIFPIFNKVLPIGFRHRFKLLALQGEDVFCPCCNNGWLLFFPYGNPVRYNARCPKCSSFERQRLQLLFLKNKTNLFSKQNQILHVAPEIALHDFFIANKKITYVAIDLFTGTHTYKNDTINMDVTNLKFENNTFDAIICNHVLEHVIDDIKAMKELYRTLKSGGFAILQVPLDKQRMETYEDISIVEDKDREKAFGQSDHVRIYGRDYKNRLEDAGFKVTLDNYVDSFSAEEIFKYGLMLGEDIYYCKKK